MKKVKLQDYYQWLGDEQHTLFRRIARCGQWVSEIAEEFLSSWCLPEKKIIKIHQLVVGAIRFEIDELYSILHEILKRAPRKHGNITTVVKRYKWNWKLHDKKV